MSTSPLTIATTAEKNLASTKLPKRRRRRRRRVPQKAAAAAAAAINKRSTGESEKLALGTL